MGVNRNYVDTVADIVRRALDLKIPIQLEEVCNAVEHKLPGNCIPTDLNELDVDAEIKAVNELEFEIHYLKTRPSTRVLFSVSHELGHLFLHLLDKEGRLKADATCQRNLMQTQQELEANEFAAAFLMPEEAFINECKEQMCGDRVNVTRVANYFNVSVQAATVRGNVLGLW